MKHLKLFTFVITLAFACSPNQDSKSTDGISGVYVREYSFKVVNPETGAEIGMRSVRDTIFIRATDNGYDVSNAKWRKNSYDAEGWQNMAHSDDRPMPTYLARYAAKDGTISPQQTGLAPILYSDIAMQVISKGPDDNQRYSKTK